MIVPFFRTTPTAFVKATDFEKFSDCLEIITSDRHLTTAGLIEIAEITQTMNHRKPRHELIRILRGHTPNTLDTG